MIRNTKLGGTDWETPTARIKPTDLNDTIDGVLIGNDSITNFVYDEEDRISEITQTINGVEWNTIFNYTESDQIDTIVTTILNKEITETFDYNLDTTINSITKVVATPEESP